MSTRRRIGVNAATTEAARRQLMQPVPCWERTWVTAENNSSLRVLKWVKTDKVPQFNENEVQVDEPLAPLPDAEEAEVIDGDDEDENAVVIVEPTVAVAVASEAQEVEENKVDVEEEPTTQLTLDSTEPDLRLDDDTNVLDESLKAIDVTMDVEESLKMSEDAPMELDMSSFGPDGLGLEGSHDLSQMEATDALMGGVIMDESADPFATADTLDTQ